MSSHLLAVQGLIHFFAHSVVRLAICWADLTPYPSVIFIAGNRFCQLVSAAGGRDSAGSLCGVSDEPGRPALLLPLQQVWALLQPAQTDLRTGSQVRQQRQMNLKCIQLRILSSSRKNCCGIHFCAFLPRIRREEWYHSWHIYPFNAKMESAVD